MRVALDTNILACAEGVGDIERRMVATQSIRAIEDGKLFIATQALMELYNVLVRKGGLTPEDARERIAFWQVSANPVPTTPDVLTEAMELSVRHQFRIWDAIIVVTAGIAGCSALLTEDMHAGFVWRGTMLVNPFRRTSAAH